ncbi:hypothetical protein [Photobacterium damselae]|uniref:hypothetical protein n=1 Tax=Photobacterium damselae TaxID=38293 RepID=UPI004068BD36
MTNIQEQLDILRAKKNLTGAERAQIKVFERELKKANKEKQDQQLTNVFATTPTTKITPLPIRFGQPERTGLKQLSNDIKSQSLEKVIIELGHEGEINETKLVRAAVYLLKKHSHAEIIDAIKQVKLNMIR